MKKADAEEGKKEVSFWGQTNELGGLVEDCLLWEGLHAGAGEEC